MERSTELSPTDSVLVGLEEIFDESFFSKLRLALQKTNPHQRLFEILTAVGSLNTPHTPFIKKMREALDKAEHEEFWIWLLRALNEIDPNHKGIGSLRNAFQSSTPVDFNINLLKSLQNPLNTHTEILNRVCKALENSSEHFDTEALRIFDRLEGQDMELLQKIRQYLETDQNLSPLLKGFESYEQWSWVNRLRSVLEKNADEFQLHSLSRGQVQSKKWAIQKIYEIFGADVEYVHIMCGWHGLLGTLMHLSGHFNNLKVRSYDIDPSCESIAETLNRDWVADGWKFKAETADVMSLDFGRDRREGINVTRRGVTYREPYSLIINTSCEHLENFTDWMAKIPLNTPLLLQSNDAFDEKDHVNCSKNLEEFQAQAGLSRVEFAGVLPINHFNRFMLVGYK